MTLQKTLRIIVLAALFFIPIFPLIVANSFFFPFITGKAFYFRLLVELAFASWIILAFLDAKYRPKFTWLTIGVTAFTVIALLADLLGVNPARSIWSNFERMEGWIVIIHLWAFYMVATSLFGSNDEKSSSSNESKKLWHRWINFSLIVAFIVAIYGLFQLFGWAAIHQGSSRLDASLGNSAYMAVYMLFHAFLAGYLFFDFRVKKVAKNERTMANLWHWSYAVLAVLFAFILLETQTRGSILGLIGGIMLALIVYSIFGKKEQKKWRLISTGILAFIVILGVIFWFNRHQPFIEQNPILGRFSNISWNESSNQARQFIWPMAINGALERPILGWGQENFNYIFNANYNPKMYSQEQWFDRAHSVFLDWFVAGGFLGLIAYLSLYVFFLLAVWKSDIGIAKKSVLIGLLAGYFVHNIFVFDNLASYVMFFAVLGLANSWQEGRLIKQLGSKPVSEEVVEYVVAPIVIVILVLIFYFVQFRPVQANTRLISAMMSCGGPTPDVTLFGNALRVDSYLANQEIREQLLSCTMRIVNDAQISTQAKQSFFAVSNEQIQAQIEATPKDARIYTLAGSLMSGIGQYTGALPLFTKAHELSPKKQTISLELAAIYLNTGEIKKAVELLKVTYESEKSFKQVRDAYAMALVASDKEAEAKALFGDTPEIFETVQMAQAYLAIEQYGKAENIYLKLVAQNPSNIDYQVRLAQIQYTAGFTNKAIATMRNISKNNPELKDQVEEAIKGIVK
ncbi:MAG: O-antigen ligase family protein [Candidatus Paceibacterota bacterium]|jgi:O-antigen ligase/thioredoxin-like negative regulator of GroEL